MTSRTIALGAGLAIACSALAAHAAVRTFITTQWDELKLTQAECLDHAEKAIVAGKFEALPHTTESRHGIKGEYTAAVRCVAEMRVVWFVVAGPNGDRTSTLLDDIHDQFKF